MKILNIPYKKPVSNSATSHTIIRHSHSHFETDKYHGAKSVTYVSFQQFFVFVFPFHSTLLFETKLGFYLILPSGKLVPNTD